MGPESEVNLMIFSNLLIVLNEASNDTRNTNLVCLVLETSLGDQTSGDTSFSTARRPEKSEAICPHIGMAHKIRR